MLRGGAELRRGLLSFFGGGGGLQRRWGARPRRGRPFQHLRCLGAFRQRGWELPDRAKLWLRQRSFFRGGGGLQRRWGARPRRGQRFLQKRLGRFGGRGWGSRGRPEL